MNQSDASVATARLCCQNSSGSNRGSVTFDSVALIGTDGGTVIGTATGTLPGAMHIELNGLQFAHTPGAAFLEIPVHVRPASGTTLKAFQITLGPLSGAHLDSASGAGFTDGGTFSGIATQLDNPSTEVVLSASNTASAATMPDFIAV